MSDLLFDLPESKSPRLLWLEKHEIQIIDNGQDFEPGDECAETGAQLYRYCAHTDADSPVHWDHLTGWGDTPDEAIVDLAKKRGLRLWNETP